MISFEINIFIVVRILVLFKKDINAVIQPIVAPISSDNMNMLQKSPIAWKKAFVSNPPVLE